MHKSLKELMQDSNLLSNKDIDSILDRIDLGELKKKLKKKDLTKFSIDDKTEDSINTPEEVSTSGALRPLKDVTFNLEAEVIKDDENLILTSHAIEAPEEEIKTQSASGDIDPYQWPPKQLHKKSKLTTNKKKRRKKSKPYLLNTSSQELKKVPESATESAFPWQDSQTSLETMFTGGLESELIDIPDKDIPVPDTQKNLSQSKEAEATTEPLPFLEDSETTQEEVIEESPQNIEIKAILPSTQGIYNESNEKDVFWGTELTNLEANNKKGTNKKQKTKMPSNSKISPLRIIFYGGAAVTILYLLWSNYGSEAPVTKVTKKGSSKVIVRDVLKRNSIRKEGNVENVELGMSFSFSPISKEQRLQLIMKAREAIESRLDPFGQEAALPPSTLAKMNKAAEDSPNQIEIQRKQIELVGIISSTGKELALVNIYTADFSVNEDEDPVEVENKLKEELKKALPNRVEVFVLDPIEDWYIKAINKSKSRTETPSVDLVKDDKRFNLRVGQKVLLPTEKTFEELVQDIQAQEANEDDIAKFLGLN